MADFSGINMVKRFLRRALLDEPADFEFEIYQLVIDRYKFKLGKNRYYHNLDHLTSMMEYLHEFVRYNPNLLSREDHIVLWLAILFHDYVQKEDGLYGQTPEIVSAYEVRTLLPDLTRRLRLSHECIEKVAIAIEKTAFHTIDQDNLTKVEAILLNLDLMYLTEDYLPAYREKVKLVSCEYSEYSEEQFKKGRSEFAKKMLARKNLFYEPYIVDIAHAKYHSKKNLTSDVLLDA